ncbi:unnamed protein product [Paramecium octaurelia]|uniref:Uncharacterized protein n=1 Tax=Paramecium octaurelia TaxID=43137 RepID=A0A8S1YN10_PAROT|nr:unnamed protein product [Paramecium octaurelia]
MRLIQQGFDFGIKTHEQIILKFSPLTRRIAMRCKQKMVMSQDQQQYNFLPDWFQKFEYIHWVIIHRIISKMGTLQSQKFKPILYAIRKMEIDDLNNKFKYRLINN